MVIQAENGPGERGAGGASGCGEEPAPFHSPELPQGSTLFTLLLAVSTQGSGGGTIEGGGAPPPQGSVLVGDVGDATPHGSVEAAPHGTDIPGADTMGGGEGPADPMVAAVAGAPHGSTALSSIKAPCGNRSRCLHAG